MDDSTNNGLLAKLYAALGLAQGEFAPIAKSKTANIKPRDKPAYQFKYADAIDITTATRPALVKHGLTLIQKLDQSGPKILLSTILAHRDGGVITSRMEILTGNETDIKQVGAKITYLRRYAKCAILDIHGDDDIDGDELEGGDNRQTEAGPPFDPDSKPETTGKAPVYAAKQFDANLASWEKMVAEGRKTPDELISFIESKGVRFSAPQRKTLLALKAAPHQPTDPLDN